MYIKEKLKYCKIKTIKISDLFVSFIKYVNRSRHAQAHTHTHTYIHTYIHIHKYILL